MAQQRRVQTTSGAQVGLVNRQPAASAALPEHESYLLCPGRQPMQIPPNHNVSTRIRLIIEIRNDNEASLQKDREVKGGGVPSVVVKAKKDHVGCCTRQNNSTRQEQQQQGRRCHYCNQSHYHYRPPTKHIIDIYHWITR